MLRIIKNIFTFPIAFAYVMLFTLYYFLKLFAEGNQFEHVLQILFVKIQNRLDKLVYRAAWLAPIVYGCILLKLYLMICHIKF